MKRRTRNVESLKRRMTAAIRGFRAGVAITTMLIIVFAATLPLAAAAKKEKASSPAPKGTTRLARPRQILAAPPHASMIRPGQTVTLLPDGRSLLIGGESATGPRDEVVISNGVTGQPVPAKTKLHHARAWHSATMLPDGNVLVLGGIGKNGEILKSAEIFNPETQSFAALAVPEMAAVAYHSATLLTDGQVLITGGSLANDRTLLWDFKTRTFHTLPAKLSAARQKQKATLLFDGNLLIEGGTDENGDLVKLAELFNVATGTFSFTTISSEQMDQGAPFLAGALPANNAADVAVDAVIALRFSKRLRVETLNTRSITLTGSEGTLEAKVVPAEGGRLAFVTPKVPLLPGMTYTVSIGEALDESGATITPASTTFTTKGTAAGTEASGDGEGWNPDWTNLHGNWQRKHEDSPWRSLPLLRAEEGVTALAGQVLTLDGKPLANTTLRIGDKAAQTDKTGRFLLSSLTAGRQVMVIDGRTASRNKKAFGVFKAGVELSSGKTNALGYTIWMPRLDTRNVVTISSPTKNAVKVTNPAIPGLELRLPAGTVIRDLDGEAVTEVSITAIPTNQPPFPLPPNVDVPVYFTIQPGGSQIIPPRAQLIYPNFIGSKPGTRIDFYNYDAAEKGWYIYGQGTVTPDGKQIIPDAGVTLYEFSGAMVALPTLAPTTFVPCGRGNFAGAGVDLGSGLFVHNHNDLTLGGGLGGLSLARTYRPNDTRSREFGIGSSHIYDMYLVGSVSPYTFMDLVGPDGSRTHFNRISAGTGFTDAVFQVEPCGEPTSCTVTATIKWNAGGWIVIYDDGTKLVFPEAFGASTAQQSAIIGYEDPFGNSLSFMRDASSNLTRIGEASGRWMDFTYDSSNRVTQARDNLGRVINYTYDSSGRLASVTNAANGVQSFLYDSSHRMTQITDERGIVRLKNDYDTAGRVIKQTFADETETTTDNPSFSYAYTLDSGGRVVQTDVTDPQGRARRVTFDANGYTSSETYALGLATEQTTTYERDTGTHQLLSVTDTVGRKVAYSYDSAGRITDVTRLAETAEAVTTHYEYTPDCDCDDVVSITDPLNHTISFEYDDKHKVKRVTDALNHSTEFTYNGAGQMLTSKDALNNLTQMSYENGDLMGITDPRGHSGSAFIDGAGRLLSARTPDGQMARYEYDALDRPIKAIGPLGGVTEFTYDANSNLLSVEDANNNLTSYTYDNLNRVTSRIDPLLHEETYEYDLVGLRKYTDRRGKVTSYSYDDLGRLTFVGYGVTGSPPSLSYESTVTYVYNTAGELEEVTDSVSGTTEFTYDNLGQVLSKTTPQGTVSYTYDEAGRRTSMTVAGQTAVNYTYNNVNRLTQIAQGTRTVSFAYDNVGRMTSVTHSNGLSVEYGYDQGSNLTSMVYKKDTTVLGDLTYEYDAVGKRTRTSGSFARTGMPQALSSTTYGDGNQLTQRGSASFSYDENGNLTSDGANTYTWNARNQLVSISGAGLSASFQYDAFGNRVNKTVNGVSRSYLYDGKSIVQELYGSTPTANLVTGATDQIFNRTDSSGARTLLADQLGSIFALADDSGTLQTEYTYDPFGNTSSTGSSSSNSAKYTGREDDGTGLYYYRARYYSPALQRFISEDPAGFSSGDPNLYAYVSNDPINTVDPSGLCGVGAILGPQPFDATHRPLTLEQTFDRDIASFIAWVPLIERPECRKYVTGKNMTGEAAVKLFSEVVAKMTYDPTLTIPAETDPTFDRVRLGDAFFDPGLMITPFFTELKVFGKTDGEGIYTKQDIQAYMLLHEFRHVALKAIHTNAQYGDWLRDLWANCFKPK